MERFDRLGEQTQCDVRLAVRRVQAGRVAGEKTLEEIYSMLAYKRDSLVPRGDRTASVGFGESHAGDPQRVGHPIRVSEGACSSDGLFCQGKCLVAPARRLEPIDVRRQAV